MNTRRSFLQLLGIAPLAASVDVAAIAAPLLSTNTLIRPALVYDRILPVILQARAESDLIHYAMRLNGLLDTGGIACQTDYDFAKRQLVPGMTAHELARAIRPAFFCGGKWR